MTSGLPVEQQMFSTKDQQQCSSYLPDRHPDNGKVCLSDLDTKAVSRPSSPGGVSHHGPTEMIAETGNSHSGSSFDAQPQSSPPATGNSVKTIF